MFEQAALTQFPLSADNTCDSFGSRHISLAAFVRRILRNGILWTLGPFHGTNRVSSAGEVVEKVIFRRFGICWVHLGFWINWGGHEGTLRGHLVLAKAA